MENENQEINISNDNAEQLKQQEPTVEDLAKEKGWRPKEEYNGDPRNWRSAEVFLALEEPIKKIENLAKELKEQKKANQYLLDHHQKVKESEFKRAYEFLKSEKKQAYEQGDVDKVIEIDEKIAQFRETQKQQKEIVEFKDPDEPETHPEFQSWVSKNDWYNKNSEMRETADALGMKHAQNNPSKSPVEVLNWVEGQIKKLYKDEFSNPNRSKPSAVEGVSSGSGKQTSKDDSYSFSDLNEEEKNVIRTFERQGLFSKDFTKEMYIKELKQMKGGR